MKKYWLPPGEAARRTWLNTFYTGINVTYTGLFGLTAPQLALILSFRDYYAGLLDAIAVLNDNMQDLTQHKKDFVNNPKGTPLAAFAPATITLPTLPTEGGMWAYIRSIVKTIKAHAAYTTAIGQTLGVIGDENDLDESTYQPIISSALVQPGPHIILGFKKDQTDGSNFYSRVNGGQWIKRAYDTNPPYDDYTPLQDERAEKREYRCRAVINDVEIGLYSEIVTVMVGE